MCLMKDPCCFGGIGQVSRFQRRHTCTRENSIFRAETTFSTRTRDDKFSFRLSQLVHNYAEIEEGSNKNPFSSATGL